MAVRTYYGDERVSVPGPDGSRLVGTVSGVAGGRVVVALDEETAFYPIGYDDEGAQPGRIAQVLEQDLEFFVDGQDATAPSFSPEQLAYLRRTYGEAIEGAAASEEAAAANAQTTFDADGGEDEPSADDLAAAAAEALKARGGGLTKEAVANAKLPDGA